MPPPRPGIRDSDDGRVTAAASNPVVMKRALWLLLLLPGLSVFAFGGERRTCESSWHCVAPASALAESEPAATDDATALADVEKVSPAIARHVASVLLDATAPPGE